MKNKITYLLLLLCFTSLFLVACGTSKATEEKIAYKEALKVYYDQINVTSASINAVDVSSPGGANQILGYLDTMSLSFAGLANVQAPERYEPLSQLTKDANADFIQANTLYHELYSDETFANYDEEKAAVANMYYQSALSKLVQLGLSLMADEDPSTVSSDNADNNSGVNTSDNMSGTVTEDSFEMNTDIPADTNTDGTTEVTSDTIIDDADTVTEN